MFQEHRIKELERQVKDLQHMVRLLTSKTSGPDREAVEVMERHVGPELNGPVYEEDRRRYGFQS